MASGRFFTGMAVGAVVGAALALVSAPRSGQETKEQLAEAVEKTKAWFARRKRAAELRVKGAALQEMGEVMKEAGRAEEELSERQAAEGG